MALSLKMNTFLVNLDKNPERLAFMDAQLKRLGISYERIPAIYGVRLTPEQKRSAYRSFRARLVRGTPLSDGEIGCALSHCSIYRRMAQDNIEAALVLEDDIVISDEFQTVLAEAVAKLDKDKGQVIIFSDYGVPQDNRPKHGIVKTRVAHCTDAYLITLPAAKRILAANTPVITVADAWIRWSRLFGIELYRAYPTTVRQDNERFGTDVADWGSGTHGSRSCVKRRSLAASALHITDRAFEVSLDWLLCRVGL